MGIWTWLTIILLLLFSWGVFLNWLDNKQTKKLRRKYDEQDSTEGESSGGDTSGRGKAVDSPTPGKRSLSATEELGGRSDIPTDATPATSPDKPKPGKVSKPSDTGNGVEDGSGTPAVAEPTEEI